MNLVCKRVNLKYERMNLVSGNDEYGLRKKTIINSEYIYMFILNYYIHSWISTSIILP